MPVCQEPSYREKIYSLHIPVFFSGDPVFEQWKTWIRLTFLCRMMALYRSGTSSCRRSGRPAWRRGLSSWRAASDCATSWTRQPNSTKCCPLSPRTWSARSWTWLKRPGGDTVHLPAGPLAGDSLSLRLREVGYAAGNRADGWPQTFQTPGGHDGVLSRQPRAVSSLSLSLHTEAAAGLEDSARRGGADKLWAVHAPTASAVAAVSSTEAADAGGGACATIRGGGKGFRGRGGQQRGRGGTKSTTAPAASSAAPAAAAAATKDPTLSALARLASGLCFYHWNFADRSTKCSPPCSWGN